MIENRKFRPWHLVLISTLTAMMILTVLGCTSTTTTSTPGPNGTTNTVTTTKGLDPTTVAEIDSALQLLIQDTPQAIADAQQISILIHGTNALTK
jgi:hypothetical protein